MDKLNNLIKDITIDKYGLEIGGRSPNRCNIYEYATCYDNIIFSNNTVWSSYSDGVYHYHGDKKGKVFINDATNISSVADKSYDFVFGSHTLEHVANPLKALYEFKRAIRVGGYIILILPERSECFDHRRDITPFNIILDKYNRDVGEDDLSSLPEILRLHDLSKDLPAGNFENFTKRSLNNLENRCLHHHVFSENLLKEMCQYVGCEYIFSHTDGCDIWFIMKKNEEDTFKQNIVQPEIIQPDTNNEDNILIKA